MRTRFAFSGDTRRCPLHSDETLLKPPSIHAAPLGQPCSEWSRRLESTPPTLRPGDVTDAAPRHRRCECPPLTGTVPAPPTSAAPSASRSSGVNTGHWRGRAELGFRLATRVSLGECEKMMFAPNDGLKPGGGGGEGRGGRRGIQGRCSRCADAGLVIHVPSPAPTRSRPRPRAPSRRRSTKPSAVSGPATRGAPPGRARGEARAAGSPGASF